MREKNKIARPRHAATGQARLSVARQAVLEHLTQVYLEEFVRLDTLLVEPSLHLGDALRSAVSALNTLELLVVALNLFLFGVEKNVPVSIHGHSAIQQTNVSRVEKETNVEALDGSVTDGVLFRHQLGAPLVEVNQRVMRENGLLTLARLSRPLLPV